MAIILKPDNKSEEYFLNGFACSQSILLAFSDRFGIDQEIAKRISSTFGAGMGRMRKTCGALTGAFMVLGLKGSRKNNFTFWHLIFKSFSADFKKQKP